MGVYIKGMEMPTDCALMLKIFPDGRVGVPVHLNWCGTMVVNDAEAVPAHGRLIEEADAIETAWMILRGLGYLKEENPQLEQTVREVFATAPAIEVE